MNLQNSCSTLLQYTVLTHIPTKSVRLWRNGRHSSKNYSLIWCLDVGRGEHSLTDLLIVGLRSADWRDHRQSKSFKSLSLSTKKSVHVLHWLCSCTVFNLFLSLVSHLVHYITLHMSVIDGEAEK